MISSGFSRICRITFFSCPDAALIMISVPSRASWLMGGESVLRLLLS
jgi:hypothetical protein